ncbi:MAG: tetratricopeptide repeat protein [candidate division KSB1 bacterium]|nr:tetratricopeptide repeat protein [candidate division KSB1 bacterium]MDZ7302046.1 tetratricopeptide repeat protein [candidate division KSB1 bacterium]MDZ7311088.1 tetratricopeptide repeat protein [candidate division KSB1 bacterium]
MKIKRSNFLVILFCLGVFSFTDTCGWIAPLWSQEKTDQDRIPEQLLDQNMDKAALRLYRNALKYYVDKAYWKAARELIILLDYYPAFSQVDGVLYYLGESMYQLTMYKSAAKMFRFLLTKYSHSEYAAQALYGLQRVSYQTQDYTESLRIYSGIVTRFPDDDIMDGAHYHAGMAYYYQRDYDNCIATLSKVRSRSEYFDYGLYTVGLAYLKKKWSTRPL